jgi:DeoR/GlpR family transcriptional regulator of sugar metabolism
MPRDSRTVKTAPTINEASGSSSSAKPSKEVVPGTRTLPRGHYITSKMKDQRAAKSLIALHVANSYVKDFDAILLDAGSTAELIANEVFALRRFLSVLTNNMGAYAAYTRALAGTREQATNGQPEAANATAPLHGNELLITGGRYVDTYEALLGGGTIESIKPFTPNLTIIGISGLRGDEGVFCHGEEEAAVKNLLWTKPTDIRLIATDWSKIGKRDAHTFGRLDQFAMNAKQAIIVTCNPPNDISDKEREDFEDQLNRMKGSKVKVVRLDVKERGES